MRDLYQILGVPRTASSQDIRAAHRTLARRFHPDTAENGRGDPQQFAQVQEAYETLSVADFRRRYDQKQAADRGEVVSPGHRRPPKSPCGVCKTPVYASQLKLYLGRYMCQACFQRKRQRDAKRVQLGRINETIWHLKRLRVWVQSHLAAVLIVVFAVALCMARVAWVSGHGRRVIDSPNQSPASTAADHDARSALDGNPCKTFPSMRMETATIRSAGDER